MSESTKLGDTYLLWRLHIPSKYSAVAYLSSEFIFGSAIPRYVILDKATYGPEGSEDEASSFYVQYLSNSNEVYESIGASSTLMEGVHIAETHWISQL